MENENPKPKGKTFSNAVHGCILLIALYMIYDVVLNNQDAVVSRAQTSARVYSEVNRAPLERAWCEYTANLEGKTACNLVFTNGAVRTLMCVGGFYAFVIEGDVGCYPVGGRNVE